MQTDAQREDALREADRLDPSVDHRETTYESEDAPTRRQRP
jgi:hypothetical protein